MYANTVAVVTNEAKHAANLMLIMYLFQGNTEEFVIDRMNEEVESPFIVAAATTICEVARGARRRIHPAKGAKEK